MEQLAGRASSRDAGISAGIATDKLLAVAGQLPRTNIAIISLPTPEERELLNECHQRLRAIAIGESKDVHAESRLAESIPAMERLRGAKGAAREIDGQLTLRTLK